jgi:predicted trehalose synthase
MIIDEEKKKKKEFERAAKPLIRFLQRNYHPHVAAYVDSCSAELLKGSRSAFVAWLFCLDDAGYENRVKRIAESFGYKDTSILPPRP